MKLLDSENKMTLTLNSPLRGNKGELCLSVAQNLRKKEQKNQVGEVCSLEQLCPHVDETDCVCWPICVENAATGWDTGSSAEMTTQEQDTQEETTFANMEWTAARSESDPGSWF